MRVGKCYNKLEILRIPTFQLYYYLFFLFYSISTHANLFIFLFCPPHDENFNMAHAKPFFSNQTLKYHVI